MFHAVFLITIGLLFLLNSLNYLPWSIWYNLVPYWPVLIIFVGIDAILGKSSLGNLISNIINSAIFLIIIIKVIGLNLPFLNIQFPGLFSTQEYDIRPRPKDVDSSKNTF